MGDLNATVTRIGEFDTGGSARAAPRRRAVLPGGTTGAGRIDDPYPIVFESGRGATLTDVDGNSYIDFHCGYGSAFLGYGHPRVEHAVCEAVAANRDFVGVAHRYEGELAERLVDLLPEAEMVALSGGGGTDALYNAVRIARAYTGRTAVVKAEGGYQGWHGELGASTSPPLDDPTLVTLPPTIPNSEGTLPAVVEALRIVNVNDPESLRARFERDGEEIAAMVIEPVLYSAGVIGVDAEYLQLARELCDRYDAVLIFDEVISGFRRRLGGTGELAGVRPDLAVYGKAIASGYVIAVLAGNSELINELTPAGSVFYSGTFNGHPLACAAVNATLDELGDGEVFARTLALAERLAGGANEAIAAAGATAVCQQVGPLWNLYLNASSVRNYRELAAICDPATMTLNAAFRWRLREAGMFIQFRRGTNRGFICAAHEERDIDRTVEVIAAFIAEHAEEIQR